MQIHITPTDRMPIYLQIVNQVRYHVATGRMIPGEELPPIRVLAERLLVNPNTVARAYRELEVAGIVTKRRTSGTFVSENGLSLELDERLEIITPRVDTLLGEARQLGVGLDPLIDLIRHRDTRLGHSSINGE